MRRDRSQRTARSRSLRKSLTDAERLIWGKLRNGQLNGAKFRRQHPIGPYFADFCCVEAGLVIELDGGQHAERLAQDRIRSKILESKGYKVLRFWDNDVLKETAAVLEKINRTLEEAGKGTK